MPGALHTWARLSRPTALCPGFCCYPVIINSANTGINNKSSAHLPSTYYLLRLCHICDCPRLTSGETKADGDEDPWPRSISQ